MKIYSMTATFGKLAHETLTLQPGLNIIEAPNEWGKSTWCAFLVAMLYGIDTRERTKGDFLADKEHYAPWSGAPMSGRMDLNWNGRDITIERSTKGRSIFGQFRAYETATGLEVTELTAANCGQMLLGVEKSVFTRAGFLKLTDLPVTQDESLRRRLNALVTTGDESGASDALAQTLRDLKNQCKSNRANGLIPKAEAQREELEGKLRQIAQLREQSQRIQARQEDLADHIKTLENHQAALEYTAAQEYSQKAAAAQLHLDAITAKAQKLTAICADLPTEETLLRNLSQLQQLRQQQEAVQLEAQMHPAAPAAPTPPAPFLGYTPAQALTQAREDTQRYAQHTSQKTQPPKWLLILGFCLVGCGVVALALLPSMIPALVLLVLGIGCMIAGLFRWNSAKQQARQTQLQMQALLDRYRPLAVSQWETAAQEYLQAQQAYEAASAAHLDSLSHLKTQAETLNAQLLTLTGGETYLQAEQEWRSALEQHKALADALREQRQTQDLLRSFGADRPLPQPPKFPDALTFSQAETAKLLSDAKYERHQLQRELGHCQGQMETLGLEAPLRQQLEAVSARLSRLEDTYAALELAQQTLTEAAKALQRRFAPRISQRAQTLFGKLTGSRYDRLTLGEDLSLSAGAQGEDTLHSAIWRSDGTIDQLYFALRLAVAEELTPQAPLILDDALVRFDDTRLRAAMAILKDTAQHKQVILFTCQAREKALV